MNKFRQVGLLTVGDIGKWVVYKPELENERGRVKSFDNVWKVA